MMLRWNKALQFGVYVFISLLIVGVLAVREYNLTGERSVSVDVAHHHPLHGILVPQVRVRGALIREEPVYLDMRMPTLYDRARISLELKNPATPIVRVGVVTPDGGMTLATVEHKVLDALQWEETRFDTYRVLRRPGVADVEELSYDAIATYEYDLEVRLPQAPLGELVTYPIVLEGAHTVQLPVSEGKLVFEAQATDGVELVVRHEGVEIARAYHGIELNELASGLYEVQVLPQAGSRVTALITPHTKWAFVTQVHLGALTRPQTLYVRATGARLIAPTHEGVQELLVNGALVRIAESLKAYDVTFAGQGTIATGSGAVMIVGKGVYALSPDLLFVAQPLELGDARFMPPSIDAIYTGYFPDRDPEFELTPRQEQRFVFSLPGVEQTDGVTIESMEVYFTQTRNHFMNYLRLWLSTIIR